MQYRAATSKRPYPQQNGFLLLIIGGKAILQTALAQQNLDADGLCQAPGFKPETTA
jgi:hypothetical protein